MNRILHGIKKAIPEPIRDSLKQLDYRLRSRGFKPYLKRKSVEGVDFDFWISDADGRNWYDLQCTDPVWFEMRFIRDHMIEQGDVVLECGGHHGCSAILLSKWVGNSGRVVTFEPLPRNGDIIQRNLKQNGIENVMLIRQAVGAERGTIAINNVSNASVARSGQGVRVEVTRLDDHLHLGPTLLKIDVEGFELQVLQGARKILATRPKLAIEVHADHLSKYGATVDAIFDAIGVERYDLWIQREDGKTPEPYGLASPIVGRVHVFAIPRDGLPARA